MVAIAETLEYILPAWWAPALIDKEFDGYTKGEAKALNEFIDDMGKTYGQCTCLSVSETWWEKKHDAFAYVPLATDVAEFSFDITDYS